MQLDPGPILSIFPRLVPDTFLSARFWLFYQLGAYAVSFALILVLVYLKKQTYDIEAKDDAEFKEIKITAQPEAAENKRWVAVKKKLESENPADWKVAILECDVMLDEIVRRMGYPGASLGERLKNIEASDFLTLDDAWEAHKMRNQIAHSTDPLNRREVTRALSLYENVFNEFSYI